MPRNNHIYILLTYLSVLIVSTVTFLAYSWTHRQNQQKFAHPYGCYSAQQITQLMEPIGQALAPDQTGLQYATYPLPAPDRSGTSQEWKWLVELSNANGDFKGTVVWNGSTGKVEQVSLSRGKSAQQTLSSSLTPKEAAENAMYWLAKLNMVQETNWRLTSPPVLNNDQWHCRLLSPHARAYVAINEKDGQLNFARVVPTSVIRHEESGNLSQPLTD